jgi:hypothetical protein
MQTSHPVQTISRNEPNATFNKVRLEMVREKVWGCSRMQYSGEHRDSLGSGDRVNLEVVLGGGQSEGGLLGGSHNGSW